MQTRVGGLAIFDKYVPVYTTTFGGPFPPSFRGDVHHHHHLRLKKWPIETKYVEKRIVVQDVN
jgi:hypothetical protein